MSSGALAAIRASTRYCAVLGHPVKHSASPAMQNAGLEALGLDWRYLAFDVHVEELRAAILGAKAMRCLGLNLTVPHKLLALDLVDVVSDSARRWGAVNTIRFEGRAGDRWRPLAELDGADEVRSQGFNTDADAIVQSLREDLAFEPRGSTVLVLGSGGAGRVAALRLAAEGVRELHLVNRTVSKAEAVAEEIRARHPGVACSAGYPGAVVDLMLNATSAGLNAGDPLPFDEARFSLGLARAAYDMIYRPAESPFLRRAREAGLPAANGLGMLLYQGAAALELWTGRPAPMAVMRAALEQNVYGH